MAGFDLDAARSAGYSDAEIQQFLQQQGSGPPSHVTRLPASYINDPTTPEWQAKWGPLSGMNEGQQALAGVGRGMVHTGQSLGNFVGLVPNSTLAESNRL